ncbi:copper homeostasis protein CutC [Asticcacaulis sp. EMRT-3]|uniref:copper homeostasis protein CutC n=1 Tax=Asticcacaulis sp. EMRT-3 TaxID=3040349 RepID=UPI0024AF6B94|nr:copper homeostasis protein CutC [Asticcacaulis sp. EMRT-3]MDI7775174.1 copper homeostasis protein CutC [Asticcacaulis sp. EMRT-3]
MTALLEICVDSVAGLHAACQNGADRIELCAALSEGGLTPSYGLMKLAAAADLPIRAMIRPRGGDFTYHNDELRLMLDDVSAAAHCRLAGVVFGANLVSGALDEAVLGELSVHARSLMLEVALHRSFDLTPDPLAALETVIRLGFSTILTSGGAGPAVEGTHMLKKLVQRAGGRIEILAGGGVSADNADALLATGVTALHASCGAALPTREDRATQLGYVTPGQRDTDPVRVRALRDRMNLWNEEAA